jgi:hypothetical protein
MTIPETPIQEWDDLEARYQELTSRVIDDKSAYQFLRDWSDLLKEIEGNIIAMITAPMIARIFMPVSLRKSFLWRLNYSKNIAKNWGSLR